MCVSIDVHLFFVQVFACQKRNTCKNFVKHIHSRPPRTLILGLFCLVSREVFGHKPSRYVLDEYLTIFLLSIPFGYIYHARIFIPKYNHDTSIIKIYNGIDPNSNSDIQRLFYLDKPTNLQCLTSNTILIIMGRFFMPL